MDGGGQLVAAGIGPGPYILSASGLTDMEFWRLANSLRPGQTEQAEYPTSTSSLRPSGTCRPALLHPDTRSYGRRMRTIPVYFSCLMCSLETDTVRLGSELVLR